MPTYSLLQLGLFLLALLALIKPAGHYMFLAMAGKPPLLAGPGRWLETRLYRLAAVEPEREMGWKNYAINLLLFQLVGVLFLYLLQRCQAWLPSIPNPSAPSLPIPPSTPPSASSATPAGKAMPAKPP